MDTKVVNRSVHGLYNPWDTAPNIERIFVRGISDLSYHNGVGLGMADVVHQRLVDEIDWTPTQINSLTASTPAAIRTPVHFDQDRVCLEKIAPTVVPAMRHCGAIPRRYFTRSTCSNGCCQSPPSWTFAPNLTNSACRGSPHGRTETFGTSSIQQHFASARRPGQLSQSQWLHGRQNQIFGSQ